MLSLEDRTSSSGGKEVEGIKREGPSEYEISLENKNKQVRLLPGTVSEEPAAPFALALVTYDHLANQIPIWIYFCLC